jgi:hypothetical protein
MSGPAARRILEREFQDYGKPEAVTTSEIEGEILDRASVQSSIQRQLGLAADGRRVAPKEQGTAEMMVDLYRTFSAPLPRKCYLAGTAC